MKKVLASICLLAIVLALPACGWRKKEKCYYRSEEQPCIIQEEDFDTDEIVGEEEIIEYNQKEVFN